MCGKCFPLMITRNPESSNKRGRRQDRAPLGIAGSLRRLPRMAASIPALCALTIVTSYCEAQIAERGRSRSGRFPTIQGGLATVRVKQEERENSSSKFTVSEQDRGKPFSFSPSLPASLDATLPL
jgi:hypothetical protein